MSFEIEKEDLNGELHNAVLAYIKADSEHNRSVNDAAKYIQAVRDAEKNKDSAWEALKAFKQREPIFFQRGKHIYQVTEFGAVCRVQITTI